MEERERLVASLKSELERQRNGETARITEAVRSRIEELMDVLMRRGRQFDIMVEESQPRIEIGEYDIEIGS
jgi:hypothetical protein